MPVLHEETEEEVAARLAEEERDRLFQERAREAEARAAQEREAEARQQQEREAEARRLAEEEAERQAAKARRQAMARINAALDTIDHADPMLIAEVRAQRNVRGTRLVEQRVAAPSLGGLLPGQMDQIGREEAARQRGWENEQRARAAWVDDQADVIKRLCSGQSEENQRLIRAQFAAQKARG
jgi:colicin import membrane protein